MLTEGRSSRFVEGVEAIDAANAEDPNTLVVDGCVVPKELTHARMMCEWVLELDPAATELQLLAARAHHLRRWELPRSDYPDGRAGYLRWRAEQKRRHARAVGEILRRVGYSEDDAARVGAIVRKEGLARDVQVQVHEDALCLVFLQTQLADVRAQLGDDKTIDVLARTIPKMSGAAIGRVGGLGLGAELEALVETAVGQVDSGSG